jgi:ribosomal protein S18 acetylase RimI-like enzyme
MASPKIRSEQAAPLIVDRMRPHEAESVSNLFSQVVKPLPYYNEVAKATELAKYLPTSLRHSLTKDPDSILVARITDRIAGFCFSHNDDGVVWLSWFGVHPQYRGMGIGSALLSKLEETVRNGRSHKIWCDCRTENDASKDALSKQGYLPLCTVRNHWYGQDFILWEKLVS